MSLQGYTRDIATGRYYRTGVEGAPNFVQNLQREEKKSNSGIGAASSTPKRKNIPSILHSHQAGISSFTQMTRQALPIKLNHLTVPSIIPLRHSIEDYDCHYVNQEKNCYYVAGRIVECDDVNVTVPGYVNLDRIRFHDDSRTGSSNLKQMKCEMGFTVYRGTKIDDLCGARNYILYITNGNPAVRSYNRAGIVTTHDVIPTEAEVRNSGKHWRFLSALRCCAYSSCDDVAALGTEYNIVLLQGLRKAVKITSFQDDVYALDFAAHAFTIVYGSNTGNVYMVDTRCDERLKVHDGQCAITSLKVFNYDRSVIASGFYNTICHVDTRMLRVVMNYEGHQNSSIKIPLSLKLNDKLFCSTGDDNVTRIWDLGLVKPLVEFNQPVPGFQQQVFSFLEAGCSETIVHVFCGHNIVTYKPVF